MSVYGELTVECPVTFETCDVALSERFHFCDLSEMCFRSMSRSQIYGNTAKAEIIQNITWVTSHENFETCLVVTFWQENGSILLVQA